MSRQFIGILVLAFAWPALADAAEFTIGARTIVVPDEFEIELAAGPPLVERPIAVARDELGRLYVTDSAGMSDKADKQLETKPHRIRRLEDEDGDGRYDRSVVFADRTMFPEGCMWYEGSLYVAAPPQIWKLTDADDDGRAEKREVWFDGGTLTGCANDLHGPYLGLDGWFYWCKGAFAEQRHTLPNGKPLVTRASHILRAPPDGSGLEPVLTGGMDNPVNVAFLSTGERILSCTFFQHPEAGRRDGLIHAIYGGVYGKRHDPIYSHKMTGDVMPVLVHQGAAAPCGLIAGSSSLFGGGFTDHLFACYFNLHKVVHHELIPNGPTYSTRDRDFVFCDHPDFHPTDVFEDADGSLLVVDTGGWYKVCCPTSQLAKPDVLGAVYRIRRRGAPRVEDPLGARIAWDSLEPQELARLLADPRLFVQRRATAQLRKRGAEAVNCVGLEAMRHPDVAVRQRAVWTLGGVNDPAARRLVREALSDGDSRVRHAAAHVAGLWRDPSALDALADAMSDHDDAATARAAAEAVGRIGDPRAVPLLLEAVESRGAFSPDAAGAPNDDARRIREHALIYAMIEIGDPQSTAAGLASKQAHVRRAALVALDQMDNGGLKSEQVLPLLEHSDPILKNTGAWIVSHRPEWGGELAAFFRTRLEKPLPEPEREPLTAQLAGLAKSPAIQELLVTTLRESKENAPRILALRAMAEAKPAATPAAWLDEIANQLSRADGDVLTQAVTAAAALPLPKEGHAALRQALNAIGRRTDLPREVRFAALLAAGDVGEADAALFEELTARVLPTESLETRSAAADILAKAKLSSEQRLALAEKIREVGPLELPKLLPAFEREPTQSVGLELVAALQASRGLRSLRADLLQPLLAKYPPPVQQAGEQLLAELNVSAAEQAAELDRLLAELPSGDVQRGHEVFLSKKAACASCHAVGYLGGRLGPDLTNIGKVRTERDLLEAIVFPSASYVRSYEPVLLELEDGRTLAGIIVSETSAEITLAIDPQKTQTVSRGEIAEIHPNHVSLMPQGFANLLDKQELADLLAYLKQIQR